MLRDRLNDDLGFEEVAVADDLVTMLRARAAERRYDPNQPRDKDGKWTSGGGGFDAGDVYGTDQVDGMGNMKSLALQQLGDRLERDIDDHERAAYEHYANSGYTNINNLLRGKPLEEDFIPYDGDIVGHIKALDSGIEKSQPLTDPINVYRALTLPDAADQMVGRVYSDKGFASSSLLFDSATPFIGDHNQPHKAIARITVPDGTKVWFTPELSVGNEREVILPRGSDFLVRGVERQGVYQVVDMVLTGSHPGPIPEPVVPSSARSKVTGISDIQKLVWEIGDLGDEARSPEQRYNPNQPRDKNGRWTSGGGFSTGTERPWEGKGTEAIWENDGSEAAQIVDRLRSTELKISEKYIKAIDEVTDTIWRTIEEGKAAGLDPSDILDQTRPLQQHRDQLYKAWESDRFRWSLEAREISSSPNPSSVGIKKVVKKGSEERFDEGVDWAISEGLSGFNRLVNAKHGQHVEDYFIHVNQGDYRANFSATDLEGKPVNWIQMSQHDDGNIVLHEMAHALEYRVPGMLQKSESFLNERRVRSEQWSPVKLVDHYEQHGRKTGYKPDEVAYTDDFVDPYAGRFYTKNGKATGELRSTELITMGLQQLYEDPAKFAKQDPEYAQWILETVVL